MTQTKLSPEVERSLDDQASGTRDPIPERTRAVRGTLPVIRRAWTAVDWLILAAIVACGALLVRLIAGP